MIVLASVVFLKLHEECSRHTECEQREECSTDFRQEEYGEPHFKVKALFGDRDKQYGSRERKGKREPVARRRDEFL